MHENVEPWFEDGEALCAASCSRYEPTFVECAITGNDDHYCTPWRDNRIEELEGQLKRAIARGVRHIDERGKRDNWGLERMNRMAHTDEKYIMEGDNK